MKLKSQGRATSVAYASEARECAVAAIALPEFLVPVIIPGGKPVMELPGETSRFPFTVVAPLLVTVVPATTREAKASSKVEAVHKLTKPKQKTNFKNTPMISIYL